LNSESQPNTTLAAALQAAQIDLPQDQQEKLDAYCQALWEWNSRMNLTRHTDYDLFVARDLVDTLQLSAVLADGERVLDVGTGGGVPGLVLSIIRPDLDVTVCDSVAKKAQAVGEIAAALKLPVSVAHARGEELLEITSFTSVTARAVGPMIKILRWFDEHWDSIGRMLLIKGPKWVEERGESRHHGLLADKDLRKLVEYDVPGTEWKSVILSIAPTGRA
jgi:16S rRNA (guanine527-N7)-methyltransferase